MTLCSNASSAVLFARIALVSLAFGCAADADHTTEPVDVKTIPKSFGTEGVCGVRRDYYKGLNWLSEHSSVTRAKAVEAYHLLSQAPAQARYVAYASDTERKLMTATIFSSWLVALKGLFTVSVSTTAAGAAGGLSTTWIAVMRRMDADKAFDKTKETTDFSRTYLSCLCCDSFNTDLCAKEEWNITQPDAAKCDRAADFIYTQWCSLFGDSRCQ